MSEKRAGDTIPPLEAACPFCGASREYQGMRLPSDTCCVPRMLTQLGWMVDYLRKPDASEEEREDVKAAAARIRGNLRGVTREQLDDALRKIADRSGARSAVYSQAYAVARSLLRSGGGQ